MNSYAYIYMTVIWEKPLCQSQRRSVRFFSFLGDLFRIAAKRRHFTTVPGPMIHRQRCYSVDIVYANALSIKYEVSSI